MVVCVFEGHGSEPGLLQAKTFTLAEVCNEVCVDIQWKTHSIQASKTAAMENTLAIFDTSAS